MAKDWFCSQPGCDLLHSEHKEESIPMTEYAPGAIDRVARALREEIVRQYRDDDRSKCRAGAYFWEEDVQPTLLAECALRALGEQGTSK